MPVDLVSPVLRRRPREIGDRKSIPASGFLALGNDRPQFSVLRLLVTSQVDLALEGAAAEVASEGFEPGVLARVRDEVRGLAEGFPADRAFVRLLTWKKEIKTPCYLNGK